MTRPGFGEEHPAVAPFLAPLTPVATSDDDWGGLRIEVAVYVTGPAELPPVVTCGARALVLVGDDVLVCETPNGAHILPGGQVEPGETLVGAVCREVHEETGWVVTPSEAAMLGFIHLRNVSPVPDGHRFPHPDCIHAVFAVRADPSAGPDGEWADTQGWELRSQLHSVEDVLAMPIDAGQLVLLDAARRP